jgi:Zn-dependent protease with chaperone function
MWLVAFLLAVPALAFGVATAIRVHANSELRATLQAQYPQADAAKIRGITVASLCQGEFPEELLGACRQDTIQRVMRVSALAAAAAGLGWIALIAVAGRWAQNRRDLLLLVFKPGLYLTAAVVTGLILSHALLLIASIVIGESALINRVQPGIVAAIGLGALSGIVALRRTIFSLVKEAQAFVFGRTVSMAEAPQLWALVERTAAHLGALRPDHIVVGVEPNFFVTETNVTTPAGPLTGRTLFCSLSLCRILTVGELTAIIGHELGHFRGEDTKFSEHFYPIYRGTTDSLGSLHAAGGGGTGALALLPAIAIFNYFLEAFAVAETRLGRARELAADAAGASVTDAHVMASALVKVHAFAEVWGETINSIVEGAKDGKEIPGNVSLAYASAVVQRATPSALEHVASQTLSHPTDSHPPLSVRLEALGVGLSAVSDAALIVTPTDSPSGLVNDVERLEQEIGADYQAIILAAFGAVAEVPASPAPEEPAAPAP